MPISHTATNIVVDPRRSATTHGHLDTGILDRYRAFRHGLDRQRRHVFEVARGNIQVVASLHAETTACRLGEGVAERGGERKMRLHGHLDLSGTKGLLERSGRNHKGVPKAVFISVD